MPHCEPCDLVRPPHTSHFQFRLQRPIFQITFQMKSELQADGAHFAVLGQDGADHALEFFVAGDGKLKRVVCTILSENREMRAICLKLGFHLESDLEDGTLKAELEV